MRAIVLGVAQDGGVPHAGCDCPRCSAALADGEKRQPVACLGLIVGSDGWLLDATPDLPEQWARLRRLGAARLTGIALTHLHIGHFAGLVHLGREAAATRGLPVHAHPDSVTYLRNNRPWSDLEANGHVRYQPLESRIVLDRDAWLDALPVPHRNDVGPTVAFVVSGPSRRLLYCPDVDSWDELDGEEENVVFAGHPSGRRPDHRVASTPVDRELTTDLLRGRSAQPQSPLTAWLIRLGVAIALVDGTFFGPEELPRPDVPHPPMTAAMAALAGTGDSPAVLFTHLNHTNPAWDAGPERAVLNDAGLSVAAVGDNWRL